MLRGIEGGMGWRKEATDIGREEIERGGRIDVFVCLVTIIILGCIVYMKVYTNSGDLDLGSYPIE